MFLPNKYLSIFKRLLLFLSRVIKKGWLKVISGYWYILGSMNLKALRNDDRNYSRLLQAPPQVIADSPSRAAFTHYGATNVRSV